MVKIWKARETTVKIIAADSLSIDASGSLDADFGAGTDITGKCKNVTIVEPEIDQEKIDLLGTDGNSFQNAALDAKPATMAECSGTLVHDGDEVLETFAYGSGTSISGGYTRYQVGDGDKDDIGMLINLDDGSNEVNIVLDNAWITKLGDRKLDSADGHWEQDFTIKCLPKDYYIEYKD